MQLNLDNSNAQYQITRYELGHVTVNGQDYTKSILLMADHLSEWPVHNISQLQQSELLALLELHPDVILIGTGDKLIFPPDELLQTIKSHGVGIEVMNTPAACRTYTVLIAEGRRVLAALML
jgi:uncharacterized protein